MEDTPLITTIAIGFTGALAFGLLARKLNLSPIVGYLIAGIAIGPFTPGIVVETDVAKELAEIGVILLMFGVGLHFDLHDLLAVRKIAVPGAIGQSLAATLGVTFIAWEMGWPLTQGVVLGLAVSVASTVVLLRVLMDNGKLETPAGHVAIGWLIVEDLFTVLILVVLPALNPSEGEGSLLWALGVAIAKVVALGAIVFVAGKRFVPWLLLRVARLRSRELFTLAVLVLSIAMAAGAYKVFGVTMALGAFLAGMLVGQSRFSHQAGADVLPLRDAFAVIFFVSMGMLFDYKAILEDPKLAFLLVVVILVIKPISAFVIVLVCRHSLRTALTVAASLSQIGEFSFILADEALNHNLLPQTARAALTVGAIVSISINPWLFTRILALEPWLMRRGRFGAWLARRGAAHGAEINAALPAAARSGIEAIVVGFGPVGQTVARLLDEFNVTTMVVDMNVDTIAELRSRDRRALYGDAARADILEAAGLRDARFLVLTVPDADARMGVILAARELRPDIEIVTRARYLAENPTLRLAGVKDIRFDEVETASGLAEAILQHIGTPRDRIEREVAQIREEWNTVAALHADLSLDEPAPLPTPTPPPPTAPPRVE